MTKKPIKKLKDYAAPNWWSKTLHLDFVIEKEFIKVSSKAALTPNGGGPLKLDKGPMDILSVKKDGVELPSGVYQVEEECLTLEAPGTEPFELEIVNHIYPKQNTALSGIYESDGIIVSQCESEGFRNITPFIDRPDNLCRFSVGITTGENYPVLLSNGNLMEKTEKDGRRRVLWEDPFPKPSYLFALVAGDLDCLEDEFITASGRKVCLKIYAESTHVKRCRWAMESLKRAMKWDEERYGLEYDLDLFMIVAVDNFNFGAMENKGLNIFNCKYLIGDRHCATDDALINIESVVAHEYFHNWTGNRVTLRDWFQLSLKEGLTVFRTQQFTEEVRLGFLNRIREASLLRSSQFPEDAGPTAHPVRPDSYIEINNFYTLTIYEKGAALIYMMYRILGDEKFINGVKLYLERNDGGACVLEDFRDALEEASGIDLSHFFEWYGQSGLAELYVGRKYDAQSGELEIELKQRTPPTRDQKNKKPMHIPVDLAILHRQLGEGEYRREERLVHLHEAEKRIRLENIGTDFKISINRKFTAPVVVRSRRTVKECGEIMGNETDGFTRWEAGQFIQKRTLSKYLEQEPGSEKMKIPEVFFRSLRRVLKQAKENPDMASISLMTPSYSEMMLETEEFNPIRLYAAVKKFRLILAEKFEDTFIELYLTLEFSRNPAFSKEEIGKRKLKNALLNYLCALESPLYLEWAGRQYEDADNLTDKLGALSALLQKDTEISRSFLKRFEDEYGKDYQVFIHWFGLQSASPLYGDLEKIKTLLSRDDFRAKNPNTLYTLFGRFAALNLPVFHALGGEGYEFLTENILRLDASNPSVSAHLCLSFSCYDRLARPFREKMGPCLEKICASPGISAGLLENVTRILGREA